MTDLTKDDLRRAEENRAHLIALGLIDPEEVEFPACADWPNQINPENIAFTWGKIRDDQQSFRIDPIDESKASGLECASASPAGKRVGKTRRRWRRLVRPENSSS